MSERGTFALDRGWFDHPAFKTEPYTEREAWAWLIAEAAYLPHSRRIGVTTVALARGQMAASLRYMAEKWKWISERGIPAEARVRRFLGRLKTNDMIDAAADAGVTILTIRNYDRYQRPVFKSDAPADTSADAAPTQERRKVEERKDRKEEGAGGVPALTPVPAVASDVMKLAEEIAVIAGYPDPKNWPPSWCGAPLRVQTWLAGPGWTPEIILATCREVMAKKQDGPPYSISFFEKPIARAIGRQAAPLPKVTAIEDFTETTHAQTTQVFTRPDWRSSRDRGRAARAKLKAYVEASEHAGGGQGSSDASGFLPAA
jgi:hypothetical protein